MPLNIVLVEPEIPQNTGNIVRTCAALHASLHLIEPLGFSITDRYLKRAGLDYWHMLDIKVHKDFDTFLTELHPENLFYYTTKSRKLYTEIEYPANSYLVFGKESKGLPEELLVDNQEHCIRIPMVDESRSLNLSNSVAIAAYEYHRQRNFRGLMIAGNLHNLSWKN